MHAQFSPHVDLSVFVFTSDDVLKKLRLKADVTKRNMTIETAENNSESEFFEYKKQIEPYKEHADFRLFLERKWSYTLQA
jgi:uridine kinase